MAASAPGGRRGKGRFTAFMLAAAMAVGSYVAAPAQAAASLGTYADTLDLIWYGASMGSIDWSANPWTETGDDGSELTGGIRIGVEPHCTTFLCLIIGKDSGVSAASISRVADLSTADTATLSFDYKRHVHGAGAGLVRLQISPDGTSWTELQAWPLDTTDATSVSFERDITPWISATTTIRFDLTGSSDASHLNVDNVRIELFGANLPPLLDPIPNATIDEEVPFGFTAAADDPNPEDSLLFSLDGAPVGAAMTPDGVFSWTPTEAQGPGVYSFDVVVADDGAPSLADSQTVTLTVTETNAPPTLSPIGNRVANESSLLAFTATATDAETGAGDLTFTLSGNPPPGASITGPGDFSWTPTEAQGPGSYTFAIVVHDAGVPVRTDSETITISVNEVNRQPNLASIADKTVDEGVALVFTAAAGDPDLPANNLTYSLVGAPPGASISQTGAFTWTPSDAQGPGSYTFDVVVVDDGTPTMSDSVSAKVTVLEANIAPTVTPVSPRTVEEGRLLQLGVAATDPDTPANTVSFSLSGAPAGATITPQGTLSWTPSEAQGPATYQFSVLATDNGVPPLTGSAVVSVTVTEVNTAPVLVPVSPRVIDEGAELRLQMTATDQDLPANPLTYSLLSGPAGVAISSSGLVTWIPSEDQGPDTHVIEVAVTDNGTPPLTDSTSITVEVRDANNAPVIGPIGTITGNEGEVITFIARATDPDYPANGFSFWLSGAVPDGAAITSTGLFSWLPGEAAGPGRYTFELGVTDTGSPARSSTISVTVVVAEVNLPPSLDVDVEYTAEAGLEFEMLADASDPDLPAQKLSFTGRNLPPGANLQPDGRLHWLAPQDSAGSQYIVEMTVTDDGTPSLTDTRQFKINVTAANAAPILSPIGDLSAVAGGLLTFTATATDPDGPAEDLRFSLGPDSPQGATIDAATGVFKWIPTAAQDDAVHQVEVIVTDAGNVPKSDEETIAITVGQPNVPPSVTPPAEQRNLPGDEVALIVGANDPDGYPGPLTFEAENLPAGLSMDRDTGAISGTAGFDGIAGSPHTVTVTVSDERDRASISFNWVIAGAGDPLESTPTRSAIMSVTEVAALQSPTTDAPRPGINRSLALMSRAARAGVSEMSIPYLLLVLAIGLLLAFGRIGIVPIFRRGNKHNGVLRRFDSESGSGLVVRSSDGAEVFVHASSVRRRDRSTLVPGDAVTFRTIDGAYRDLVTRLRRRR